MCGSGRKPSRKFVSGRNAIPDVREWSGCHPRCSLVVGRPCRMSVSGWDAIPDVQEWLGGPSECPGVVERT